MNLRLLLVEDSEDDAAILLYELTSAAYQVEYERVETADEMRAALARQTWDIVLSDYSMPRFSGAVALQILQEMGTDIPFIIVSGAIGEERAVEIMRAGARDYISKANLARLALVIQRELNEAKERAARRSAEVQVTKLSRALEQSASLVMITSTAGVIEYVNPAFTRVTGYLPEEVIGVHSRILKSGATQREVYKQLWTTILAGDTWRGELQNRKKNGEVYWAETIISAIKNPNGEIVQFMSVQEDISARKKLEAELFQYTTQLEQMVEERTDELRRAKDQIELILTHTSDALALTKPNGDVETVNPAFRATFDEPVARSIENILWLLATDEQIRVVSDALLHVIYDHDSKRVEAQIIAADSQERDIDLVLTPVQLDSEDSRSGVLVSARDITQLKEVERFKARFVADAVHDLATPITGLETRLYLLKRNPERLADHVRALENQVEHLRNLLNDLKTLSQLDRRQITLKYEPVNINELIQRVFDTYEPVCLDRRQSLIFTADSTLPVVQLDRSQFERVIVNLVANAVNYTPDDKTIRIATMLADHEVVVTVADQGIGISAEDLPYIFDRFFRTTQARQTHQSGTGLGLAIVKEIIELHGGTVLVTSTPENGTVFEIRLTHKTD